MQGVRVGRALGAGQGADLGRGQRGLFGKAIAIGGFLGGEALVGFGGVLQGLGRVVGDDLDFGQAPRPP